MIAAMGATGPVAFGEWLKVERRRHGMNAETLAALAGVDYTQVSRWERGKGISPDGVCKLARALPGSDLRQMLRLADCLPADVLALL